MPIRTYYIRKTEKPRSWYLRYEIVHHREEIGIGSQIKYVFDSYAVTRWEAKYRAKQLIFEDLIKEI